MTLAVAEELNPNKPNQTFRWKSSLWIWICEFEASATPIPKTNELL